MSGHVFVTQGDLTRLWCDAWLMPTGRRVMVVHYWFREDIREAMGDRLIPAPYEHFHPVHDIPPEYTAGQMRTYPFPGYPGASTGPQPWLTNVGGHGERTPEWYIAAVEEFVRKASATGARVTRRTKPLLGVPLVGTGAGGQWFQKAEMTSALLPELKRLAEHYDVDIALVTFDDEAFAAAQVARRNLSCDWPTLTPEQIERAESLAKLALSGDLVLFLGAGVSMGAGLPSWQGLLDDLAEQTDLPVAELKKLGASDQARLIEKELGGRPALVAAIRERLDRSNYALSHSYCARLPATTAVTLNYDRLFELAAQAQGHNVHVIPNRSKEFSGRTLLKLHGCISRDDDIVLTREDYLRYRDRRAALAGFVQALLITHHMLFIGFGLSDDNFHRILDDVRKVLGDPDEPTLNTVGTVLTLWPEPLRDRLWDEEFDIVPMFQTQDDVNGAARQIELFLDYLVYLTGQRPTYLLNATYEGLLSADELALRDQIADLSSAVRKFEGTALGEELRAFLKRLGSK